MIDLKILDELDAAGFPCWRFVPQGTAYPFITYDRLSGAPSTIPGHHEATFDFDVYGKTAREAMEHTDALQSTLEKLNAIRRFTDVSVESIVDNSTDDDEVVYTLTARFLDQRR